MEIYIRPEIAALIGITAGALIVAFLALLTWLVKHLTSFAKALQAHADVNAAQAQELLATVKARREEREQCDARYTAQQELFNRERDEFRAEMRKVRDESEQANKQTTDEMVKVKGQLKQAVDELHNLRLENNRLQVRVTTLEQEGQAKDRKITELETEGQAKDQKIAELETRVNGKVDKPKTDEIPELKPTEPGESAPVVEETKEEN